MNGIRKSARHHSLRDTLVFGVEQLSQLLPQADHVVLRLSGNEDIDGFMSPELLLACRPGAIIYNLDRGNALRSTDLLDHWDRLGAAFLDVTEEEPLPAESPLWQLNNIIITSHRSCLYKDYRRLFINEVIGKLGGCLSS